MFDPASFFGHSEFELAIIDMFGGFQEAFWTTYHAKVTGFPRWSLGGETELIALADETHNVI